VPLDKKPKRHIEKAMTQLIYKIEEHAVWVAAQAADIYHGSPLDLTDGFIHLSTADQVRETAAKWFTGRTGLVLAHIKVDALGDKLKWEVSRGGALFPHLYGPLHLSALHDVEDLPVDENGMHMFGPTIP
jgi:uncharacterized protein (DUF952 family)